MLRRLSHRTRRRLASTILALAIVPQAACGYVERFMPWHDQAATLASYDGRVDEAAKDRGPLQAQRDRMREARDRAWQRVAQGKGPRHYDLDDAIALSDVSRKLDETMGWERAPVAGHATLADLPRADWWYLLVSPREWARGPLAIDRDHRPGYYAAMTDALEHVIAAARPGAPALSTDGYLELHRLATAGVFEREHEHAIAPGFTHERNRYPIAALHEVGILHEDHLAQAIAELKDEGVAGWNSEVQRHHGADSLPAWLAKALAEHEDVNPHTKPAELVYQRANGPQGPEEWLVGMNAYEDDAARNWAAQWLADFATEMAKAPHRSPAEYLDMLGNEPMNDDFGMELKPGARPSDDLAAAVRPIARLVRRMQVSHLFSDRAEAVDAMLLLNYLLAVNGLPPSIVEDPSMFGGREPVDELVAEIVKGQERYQVLVRELVARQPPAPTMTGGMPGAPGPLGGQVPTLGGAPGTLAPAPGGLNVTPR